MTNPIAFTNINPALSAQNAQIAQSVQNSTIAQNNLASKILKNESEKQEQDPWKKLIAFATGLAACIGIGKGVDAGTNTRKPFNTNVYKHSGLYKASNWLDNTGFSKLTDGAVNIIGAPHRWMKNNNKLYEEIAQKLASEPPNTIMGRFLNAKPTHEMLKDEFIDKLAGLIPAQENTTLETMKNQLRTQNMDVIADSQNAYITANKTLRSMYNKIQILEKTADKGFLPKLLSKFTIGTGRMFNPGGGGIMSTIFLIANAYFLGESINKALNAPKGDKFKTFMESIFSDWIGGFIIFPIIVKGVNKLINLRNLNSTGLTAGAFKLFGKFMGLCVKPNPTAITGSNALTKGLKHTGRFMKGLPGGLIRAGLVFLVISPFVSKMLGGISHKIFGKPKIAETEAKANQINTIFETAQNSLKTITHNNPQNIFPAFTQQTAVPTAASRQAQYYPASPASVQNSAPQRAPQPAAKPAAPKPLSPELKTAFDSADRAGKETLKLLDDLNKGNI